MAGKGLTKEQVEHVVRLASLPISSNELQLFQAQLSEVVEYIGKISRVKERESRRAGVEQANVTREDKVEGQRTLAQDKATSGARRVHNGLFMVPAIFEET